jgi:hypothetical protein
MKHTHTEHCEHVPPVHPVPIAGMPVLIPLLVIAAWVAVRRKGK